MKQSSSQNPKQKIPFSIGICAYNEEENIGHLLKNILSHKTSHPLEKIIVVASGCTDQTVPIVKGFAKKDPRVGLIFEEKRRGKYSAINEILKACQTPILVMTDADCLLEKGAVDRLLKHFQEGVGAVAGRAIPLNKRGGGFWGYAAHFRYQLSHLGAVISSDRGNYCHLSGYLYALKAGIIKKIPPVICDDLYIGVTLLQKGYQIIYEPKARVNILHPTNLSDLIKQRKNIRLGHLQIEQLTGHHAANTVPLHIIPLVLVAWESEGRGPRELFFTLILALIEQFVAFWALLDSKLGKVPLAWDRISSSKRLIK